MEFEISLGEFYSTGDERRFFQGLEEVPGMRSMVGHDRGLVLNIDLRLLSNDGVRELIAVLWRYDVSLSSLRILAEKQKKFVWLRDAKWYWHNRMFGSANLGPGVNTAKRTRTKQ
jgi:hypothetical protein